MNPLTLQEYGSLHHFTSSFSSFIKKKKYIVDVYFQQRSSHKCNNLVYIYLFTFSQVNVTIYLREHQREIDREKEVPATQYSC